MSESKGTRMAEFLHKQSFPIEQAEELARQIPIQSRTIRANDYNIDVSSLTNKYEKEMEQTMEFPYGAVWDEEDVNDAKRRLEKDILEFIEKNEQILAETGVISRN